MVDEGVEVEEMGSPEGAAVVMGEGLLGRPGDAAAEVGVDLGEPGRIGSAGRMGRGCFGAAACCF